MTSRRFLGRMVILFIAVCLLTSTVSAFDPFGDALAGINGIYNTLLNVGLYIWTMALVPFLSLVYPFVLALNLLYYDLNMLYQPSAALVNTLTGMPNTVLSIVNNWTPTHQPAMTSDAIADLAGTYVGNAWELNKHAESTSYALLSVAIMILAALGNVVLRIIRFLVWLYKKIPIIGGH